MSDFPSSSIFSDATPPHRTIAWSNVMGAALSSDANCNEGGVHAACLACINSLRDLVTTTERQQPAIACCIW